MTATSLFLLAWVIADVYFSRSVSTLTDNSFVLYGYWLIDVLIATGFGLLITKRRLAASRVKLILWLMAFTLLTLIPKIFAMPVLLLEDITRLFRHFPPRSIWVKGNLQSINRGFCVF